MGNRATSESYSIVNLPDHKEKNKIVSEQLGIILFSPVSVKEQNNIIDKENDAFKSLLLRADFPFPEYGFLLSDRWTKVFLPDGGTIKTTTGRLPPIYHLDGTPALPQEMETAGRETPSAPTPSSVRAPLASSRMPKNTVLSPARPTTSPNAKTSLPFSTMPTAPPTTTPTAKPTTSPTAKPTTSPTAKPTISPTAKPTISPTAKPTISPTAKPTTTPLSQPKSSKTNEKKAQSVSTFLAATAGKASSSSKAPEAIDADNQNVTLIIESLNNLEKHVKDNYQNNLKKETVPVLELVRATILELVYATTQEDLQKICVNFRSGTTPITRSSQTHTVMMCINHLVVFCRTIQTLICSLLDKDFNKGEHLRALLASVPLATQFLKKNLDTLNTPEKRDTFPVPSKEAPNVVRNKFISPGDIVSALQNKYGELLTCSRDEQKLRIIIKKNIPLTAVADIFELTSNTLTEITFQESVDQFFSLERTESIKFLGFAERVCPRTLKNVKRVVYTKDVNLASLDKDYLVSLKLDSVQRGFDVKAMDSLNSFPKLTELTIGPKFPGLPPLNCPNIQILTYNSRSVLEGRLDLSGLNGLEQVTFGNDFNKEVMLPSSGLLKTIIFGAEFNSIIFVKEGEKTKVEYDMKSLAGLESLTFGTKFNQKIRLPASLKSLIFGDDFNNELKELPKNIETLHVGKNFKSKILYLPNTLTSLRVPKNLQDKYNPTWFDSCASRSHELLEVLKKNSNKYTISNGIQPSTAQSTKDKNEILKNILIMLNLIHGVEASPVRVKDRIDISIFITDYVYMPLLYALSFTGEGTIASNAPLRGRGLVDDPSEKDAFMEMSTWEKISSDDQLLRGKGLGDQPQDEVQSEMPTGERLMPTRFGMMESASNSGFRVDDGMIRLPMPTLGGHPYRDVSENEKAKVARAELSSVGTSISKRTPSLSSAKTLAGGNKSTASRKNLDTLQENKRKMSEIASPLEKGCPDAALDVVKIASESRNIGNDLIRNQIRNTQRNDDSCLIREVNLAGLFDSNFEEASLRVSEWPEAALQNHPPNKPPYRSSVLLADTSNPINNLNTRKATLEAQTGAAPTQFPYNPNSLKVHLEFSEQANVPDRIPENTISLTVAGIKLPALNKELRSLNVGNKYNQKIQLPDKVKMFVALGAFNSDILCSERSELERVMLGDSFNKTIRNLPRGIKELIIGDNFDLPTDFGHFERLERLVLGNKFNREIETLPPTLTKLKIGTEFKQKLPALPPNQKVKIDLASNYPYINFLPTGYENDNAPVTEQSLKQQIEAATEALSRQDQIVFEFVNKKNMLPYDKNFQPIALHDMFSKRINQGEKVYIFITPRKGFNQTIMDRLIEDSKNYPSLHYVFDISKVESGFLSFPPKTEYVYAKNINIFQDFNDDIVYVRCDFSDGPVRSVDFSNFRNLASLIVESERFMLSGTLPNTLEYLYFDKSSKDIPDISNTKMKVLVLGSKSKQQKLFLPRTITNVVVGEGFNGTRVPSVSYYKRKADGTLLSLEGKKVAFAEGTKGNKEPESSKVTPNLPSQAAPSTQMIKSTITTPASTEKISDEWVKVQQDAMKVMIRAITQGKRNNIIPQAEAEFRWFMNRLVLLYQQNAMQNQQERIQSLGFQQAVDQGINAAPVVISFPPTLPTQQPRQPPQQQPQQPPQQQPQQPQRPPVVTVQKIQIPQSLLFPGRGQMLGQQSPASCQPPEISLRRNQPLRASQPPETSQRRNQPLRASQPPSASRPSPSPDPLTTDPDNFLFIVSPEIQERIVNMVNTDVVYLNTFTGITAYFVSKDEFVVSFSTNVPDYILSIFSSKNLLDFSERATKLKVPDLQRLIGVQKYYPAPNGSPEYDPEFSRSHKNYIPIMSLQYAKVKMYVNSNFAIKYIPDLVTEVTFYSGYTHPLPDMSRNSKISSIKIGSTNDSTEGGFNHPVNNNNLPPLLKHLTIGNGFNQTITSLPNSLVSLSLGNKFNRECSFIGGLTNLEYLHLGNAFNMPLSIPHSIVFLVLGDSFNSPLLFKDTQSQEKKNRFISIGSKFDTTFNLGNQANVLSRMKGAALIHPFGKSSILIFKENNQEQIHNQGQANTLGIRGNVTIEIASENNEIFLLYCPGPVVYPEISNIGFGVDVAIYQKAVQVLKRLGKSVNVWNVNVGPQYDLRPFSRQASSVDMLQNICQHPVWSEYLTYFVGNGSIVIGPEVEYFLPTVVEKCPLYKELTVEKITSDMRIVDTIETLNIHLYSQAEHLPFEKMPFLKNLSILCSPGLTFVNTPKNLQSLSLYFDVDTLVSNPAALLSLSLIGSCSVIWPTFADFKNLEFLVLGDNFNSDINSLPERLRVLKIGNKFNKRLPALPDTIETLIIGDSFNNDTIKRLPSKLNTLSLGNRFNQPLPAFNLGVGPLPRQMLYLGNAFNQSLENVFPQQQWSNERFHFPSIISITNPSYEFPSSIPDVETMYKKLTNLNDLLLIPNLRCEYKQVGHKNILILSAKGKIPWKGVQKVLKHHYNGIEAEPLNTSQNPLLYLYLYGSSVNSSILQDIFYEGSIFIKSQAIILSQPFILHHNNYFQDMKTRNILVANFVPKQGMEYLEAEINRYTNINVSGPQKSLRMQGVTSMMGDITSSYQHQKQQYERNFGDLKKVFPRTHVKQFSQCSKCPNYTSSFLTCPKSSQDHHDGFLCKRCKESYSGDLFSSFYGNSLCPLSENCSTLVVKEVQSTNNMQNDSRNKNVSKFNTSAHVPEVVWQIVLKNETYFS